MGDRQHGTLLESERRLSESSLWKLQRAFYDRAGVEAWSKGRVPHYVTNNPFIANAYVGVILGYLRDCLNAAMTSSDSAAGLVDPDQPFNIIELGTGTGRLGYLLLKRLLALKDMPPLDRIRFRYIMTDVTESNIRFWRDHPSLRPFLDEGMLDFALFDGERQQEIALLREGSVLSAETMGNPIIVIANYVFDSMVQDAFRVDAGVLHEGLIALASAQAHEPDPGDPGILERLSVQSRYVATVEAYYEDAALNQVLKLYGTRFANASFLFPVGALRCIRNLVARTRGNLLLLAADKGYTLEQQLLDRDPALDMQGSLALQGMAVNLHAVRQFVELEGGRVLHTSPRSSDLVISAVLAASSSQDFLATRAAFTQEVESFSPIHFYELVTGIRKIGKIKSIEPILSLLRLSRWDPQVILWFAETLRELAASAPELIKQELEDAMNRVWDNYFPIGESDDLPFEVATILQKMDRQATALRFYERSRKQFGEHHATAFNSGLCLYQLGRTEEALRFIEKALELDATYRPAQEWKAHIKSQLGI